MKRLILSFFCVALVLGPSAFASDKKSPTYKRNQIREARFGDDEKQTLVETAYQIDAKINAQIFGQEAVATAIRDKLVQYLEGFGHRENEPIYLNLMGLPGIGKSAMLKVLAEAGLQMLVFDAQTYEKSSGGYDGMTFSQDLSYRLDRIDTSKPYIVVIEELDKIPEINHESANEKTHDVIGTLNKILVDGKFSANSYGTNEVDLSNALILTTMNLSPVEMTNFSAEALKKKKSFYDFTVEDFEAFHSWVLSNPSAIPKLLANLFRTNTVSRMAPASILVKPLSLDAYEKITVKAIQSAISRNSSERDEQLRLEVTFTDSFVKEMNKLTVYPPSGARNTVTKVDLLTEQLINFSKRVSAGDPADLLTPRKVLLNYNRKTKKFEIQVTPLKIVKNKELVELKPIRMPVEFSKDSGLFTQPKDLALSVEAAPSSAGGAKAKPLTKKQIRESRFPENSTKAKGLTAFIGQTLFGQEKFAQALEEEMNQYLVRQEDTLTPPNGIIFAGFPGIGKSEMINLASQHLKLPVIKINLQQYSSDSNDAMAQFASHLSSELERVRSEGHKKFIVLFEEMDKVYEISARGEQVNRPVLSVIKDLMNNGKAEISIKDSYHSQTVKLDLTNAFVATTMNFSVDRFDFKADPRLTTLEDVENAWRLLSTRLADLKGLLGTMFLPETVNRMISRIKILKPLSAQDYEKVIAVQVEVIKKSRFTNKDGVQVGQIEIQLSPEYRDYLFNESVVPSEGARFAANMARSLISLDVEAILKSVPKSSPLSAKPLLISIGYKPGARTVVGTVSELKAGSAPSKAGSISYKRVAELNFPPLNLRGKIPLERLVTAIHEYGHAMAAVNGGLPFEYVTVVPPSNGTGGYVKFRDTHGYANEIIAQLYATMASRAMERVMMSSDPLHDNSVLDITAGASQDILQATQLLFSALKQLGFMPGGGVMERTGVAGMSRYANFSDLSAEEAEAFGLVLKDIEDALVRDFLKLHSREWYAAQVEQLARKGGMTEKEFYELNRIAFPGVGWVHTENNSPVYELFKGKIANSKKVAQGRSYEYYRSEFVRSIEKRLKPKAKAQTKAKSCDDLLARKKK